MEIVQLPQNQQLLQLENVQFPVVMDTTAEGEEEDTVILLLMVMMLSSIDDPCTVTLFDPTLNEYVSVTVPVASENLTRAGIV